LPFSNKHLAPLRRAAAEKFSIPEILFMPEAPGTTAQILTRRFHFIFSETRWSSLPGHFFKSSESVPHSNSAHPGLE
jgi:hypothetical protein